MSEEFTPEKTRLIKKIINRTILAIVVIVLLFSSIGIVEEGERGVRTTMGKITGDVAGPGPYLKVPFFQSMNIIDVETRTIAFEDKDNIKTELKSASRDLQDVGISVVVNYRIDPTEVKNIYIQYEDVDAYEAKVLVPRISDITKSISPQYTAEELVTKRAEFNTKVTVSLMEEIQKKGSISEQVNVTNVLFSKTFTDAIEAKVTAQQDAERAKNQLERTKYEAQQQIEKARGEAESIRIQSQALSEQPQFLDKLAIERWSGDLPVYWGGNGPLPFLNIK